MKQLVSGLSHITLVVKDLEKATLFLMKIFGACEIYASGDQTHSISKEKFFLIGDIWVCIMEGEALARRTYNHVAFQIQDSEMDDYIARIESIGIGIEPGRTRVAGEGRSIYFYDFDNHLFELHTGTLKERLQAYGNTGASPKDSVD